MAMAINGTSGNDTLNGRLGADTVLAGAGNDSVRANSGDDIVYGEAGNDTLLGEGGVDTLSGGSGADSVLGGIGNDQIVGGQGSDTLLGEADNDSIVGDGQWLNLSTMASPGTGALTTVTVTNSAEGPIDLFYINSSGTAVFVTTIAAGGSHSFSAHTGDNYYLSEPVTNFYLESFTATSGLSLTYPTESLNDSIDGGTGNDTIYGQFGADTIQAGAGADTIYGGTGNDNIQFGTGGATQAAGDRVYGGDGNDLIDDVPGSAVYVYNDTLYGDAGNDTIYAGAGNDSVEGGADNDRIIAEDGDDTVIGGTGADYVEGGGGNDLIDDAHGLDQGEGNDTFDGGAGNDTIWGGFGDDCLRGGDGADQVGGEEGNDTLDGGTGNDTLLGGADADLFVFSGTWGVDSVLGDSLGNDQDTISFGGADSAVTVTFTDSEDGTATAGGNSVSFDNIEGVIGSAFNDTINAGADSSGLYLDGGAGADAILGGSGDDTIHFGDGDDTQTAGELGNDLVYGDGGNDVLSGDQGNDTLYGGIGNDAIEGHLGADSIYGEEGDDYLAGFDVVGITTPANRTLNPTVGSDDGANDMLDGGSGSDTLLGGIGDDTLIGGEGNDTILGGQGSDEFYFSGSFGADQLTGGEDAGNGDIDLLDFDVTGGLNVVFTGAEAGTATDTATGATVTFSEIEAVQGGTGADTIDAHLSTSGLWLDGGAGDDQITGSSAADTLIAGDGSDTLTGGAGDDFIFTGTGFDELVLTGAGGADVVIDFDMTPNGALTTDQLDVSDLQDGGGNPVTAWDVTVSDDGFGNALLTFPGGESLTLVGVAPATVSSVPQLHAMGIPCILAGQRVATPRGPVPVEELGPGDLVLTREGGALPVLWAGARRVSGAQMRADPRLMPVEIKAGRLGNARPVRLSALHAVFVPEGAQGALVRAGHLAGSGWGGARRKAGLARHKKGVSYHHLLLPRHALISVEGLWVESFWPGKQGLAALDLTQRQQMIRALPRLAGVVWAGQRVEEAHGPAAAPVLKRRQIDRSRCAKWSLDCRNAAHFDGFVTEAAPAIAALRQRGIDG